MTGGDLRFHISRKTFTEEAIRFWIAELGCALRYVHSQNIIHRDVKPDNVLLDGDGHVHLTDFVSSATSNCSGPALTDCRTLLRILFLERSCQANPEPWLIWHPKCMLVRGMMSAQTGGRWEYCSMSASIIRYVCSGFKMWNHVLWAIYRFLSQQSSG